jgi:hypothetical protein
VVSRISLSEAEETELYTLLKPREGSLSPPLVQLLRGIESALYGRMTIEEMDALRARSEEERPRGDRGPSRAGRGDR